MFYDDHLPPHFHVEYGELVAQFDIRNLVVINGHLPPRVLGMVVEWASEHQEELIDLWGQAQRRQSLHKIPPLK